MEQSLGVLEKKEEYLGATVVLSAKDDNDMGTGGPSRAGEKEADKEDLFEGSKAG